MIDFFIGVVAGAIGLWITQMILAKLYLRMVEQQVAEIEQMIAEQKKNADIRARVENINGCFYLYDTKNGEFLAQGNTLGDLNAIIKQRWPDRMVYVTEGEGDAVEKLKATC